MELKATALKQQRAALHAQRDVLVKQLNEAQHACRAAKEERRFGYSDEVVKRHLAAIANVNKVQHDLSQIWHDLRTVRDEWVEVRDANRTKHFQQSGLTEQQIKAFIKVYKMLNRWIGQGMVMSSFEEAAIQQFGEVLAPLTKNYEAFTQKKREE